MAKANALVFIPTAGTISADSGTSETAPPCRSPAPVRSVCIRTISAIRKRICKSNPEKTEASSRPSACPPWGFAGKAEPLRNSFPVMDTAHNKWKPVWRCICSCLLCGSRPDMSASSGSHSAVRSAILPDVKTHGATRQSAGSVHDENWMGMILKK